MNITKLTIKNFLTIGEASVDLDNRGLLLIQGKNEDDPSAESNGAGKSSIVDALCWCLFGVTAREVTGDAVVNKTTKKDCVVSVILEDGGDRYVISRNRKHSVEKNSVLVSACPVSGIPTDISKGTDRETQEVINQIMGCSLDVFMAAVYAGQEKMPDLPGMTDKMLKTLIEEAAGVEVLTEAYSVARNRLVTAKAALDTTVSAQRTAMANKIIFDAEYANFSDEMKSFEDGRKDRAKVELIKTLPVKRRIAEVEVHLAANPVAPILAEIDGLDEKLKGQAAEKAELAKMASAHNDLTREGVRVKTQAENFKSGLEKAEKALASVDSRVGTPCGECGKEYHEGDMEIAKKRAVADVSSAKGLLLPAMQAIKSSSGAMQASLEALNKFTDTMTDFTEVVTLQRELDAKTSAIRLVENELKGLNREIESIGALTKVKLSEANPWEKAVDSKLVEVERTAKLIDEMTKKVEKFSTEVELLEGAVKVFGPAGVRAHILDTVTPYLNDRTQEYLGALSDGNIHAEWNTLSKTAKGELREKFNIEVVNDKGAESFAGLSGGEKRKVRLATAMALQDMVASRATKPLGIFICDEIDHALDENGLERLMGVLERKARERGTVLVISHQSLSDWIDNVITVTKAGGLATVDGATARGF